MFFDELVEEQYNEIDYNDTKTDFVLSKCDDILYEEDGIRIGWKKHNGQYILAVERPSEVGFTVVLDEGQLHQFKKKIA